MIRVIAVFTVTALLGLATNASLIHSTAPFAIAPDFILILAVILGFYQQNAGGVVGAFLLGLMADFGSAQYIGPNAAGCIVAFRLVGLIANRIYAEKAVAVFIIVFICSVVKSAGYLTVVYLYASTIGSEDLVQIILYEALFTGLAAPLVMWAIKGNLTPISGTRPAGNAGVRWVA